MNCRFMVLSDFSFGTWYPLTDDDSYWKNPDSYRTLNLAEVRSELGDDEIIADILERL